MRTVIRSFGMATREHSIKRDDDVSEEVIAKDVLGVAIEKTKKKRKRKVVGDASGSTLPPKKLKEDYRVTTFDVGGKSLPAIRGFILKGSSILSGVTEPLVVASVTPTPDGRYDEPTDSVFGLNLGTRPPDVRYVASLDDSHHSGSCFEVNSFARSPAANAPVMTVVVITTIVVDVFVVLIPNVKDGANVATLLLEKDAKIDHLKSVLSLREAEAAKVIRLRGQLSAMEAADAAKSNELRDLKKRNFLKGEKDALSKKVTTLEFLLCDELSSKVASLESKRDRLANQRSLLKSAFELLKGCMEFMQDEQATILGNRVAELDAQLLEMATYLEEESYPRFLTTISRWQWILNHGLKLGIRDGLKAGVDHGKAGRDLSIIKAYVPFVKAKYVDSVSALCTIDFSFLSVLKAKKDASIVDLMDSLYLEGPLAEIPRAKGLQLSLEQLTLFIHRAEDDLILSETSLSFSLQVVHSQVQRSLIGEASTSTSTAPATAEPITTFSTTFASSGVVPPLSVSDYQVLDLEPPDEDPPATTFEEKELDTILKSAVVS
ncbi:hypothetical protein Tco_0536280 [Tanacetum coccineum]